MPEDLSAVHDPRLARLIIHPLRRQVLEMAQREPVSASQVAQRVGEPRQKVNHHVRTLLEAGLLQAAGERKVRGATERLYSAASRSYVLSPDLLGTLQADPQDVDERVGADYLLAVAARAQAETARALVGAGSAAKQVPTFAASVDVRFRTAAQREAFTKALHSAVLDLVAKHAAPATEDTKSRPMRVSLLLHPATDAPS